MGKVSHVADYITMRRQYRPLVLPRWDSFPEGLGIRVRDYEWGFSLPVDTVVREPAIIAFVVNPTTQRRRINLEQIDYEVEINGFMFSMVKIKVNDPRAVWRVVKGGVLRADADNTITFRIRGDPEPRGVCLEFSDIVLWFQRRVAEAQPPYPA